MTTTVDLVADAERWLEGTPIEDSSALCVIGLGDGHLLEALDRRAWSGHLVALEPDAAASRGCLERRDLQAWFEAGRLTMLTGPGYDDLDKTLSSIELTSEKPMVAVNPSVARAHRDQALQAARLIGRAWFGAWSNQEARRRNGGRYLLNTLRNVDAIAAEGDAAALVGLGARAPALVAGAGPSLDRNLADIVRFRDRALIIAVDTALRPLLAAGVHPELVVALDPTETNARHLTDLPSCPVTYLVAEGSLDPEALRHFAGRTFFFNVSDHHPWPWLGSHGMHRGRLRAWGSALTAAFDLALTMGCDPIVFAGADLAFTDGRPYARGTTYEEDWYQAGLWGHPLEERWSAALAAWPEATEQGVDGAAVRTAPHLRSFRDWIVTEAEKAAGRVVVNSSGGGILIGPSIAQASVADALARQPPLGPALRDCLASVSGASDEPSASLTDAIDPPTLDAWRAFGGGECDVESVMRALGRAGVSDRRVEHSEPATPPGSALTPESAAGPATTVRQHAIECTSDDRNLIATVETAWKSIADADRLVLLDRTDGPSSLSVRRALFAFLERHPDVTARFGRFSDPLCTTSWIDKRPPGELFPGFDLDKFAPSHETVAERLVPLLIEHFAPASVIDIGCGAGFWLRALESHGLADVCGIEDASLTAAAGNPPARGVTVGDLDAVAPSRTFDVCLCLGVVQRTPARVADAIIASCVHASDTVVFSAPSAAIGAKGFVNERPSSVWHARFLHHGFAAHDELRPLIEERWGRYLSSYDLMTVYRRVTPVGEPLPASVRRALLAAARRVDDLAQERQSYVNAFNALRQQDSKRPLPRMRYEDFEISPARLELGGARGVRVFRFRAWGSILAAHTDDIDPPTVTEDGRPLGDVRIDRGAVTFSASDGTDPRHNGRRYTLRVPAHVAWLERLPVATILEHQL